jgi:acyl-CoA synthetase (AMP-forming)/AMP-acid ligase II
VVGIADSRLGQVPVAALELRPGAAALSASELREFAQQHLPPYQIPVRFEIVASLPRTVSLKVSRPGVKALFNPG